jgi:hypothetical protein
MAPVFGCAKLTKVKQLILRKPLFRAQFAHFFRMSANFFDADEMLHPACECLRLEPAPAVAFRSAQFTSGSWKRSVKRHEVETRRHHQRDRACPAILATTVAVGYAVTSRQRSVTRWCGIHQPADCELVFMGTIRGKPARGTNAFGKAARDPTRESNNRTEWQSPLSARVVQARVQSAYS